MIDFAFRHTKKFAIGLIGATVLVVGIVFFVLPGPGFIFVILGLAILATEFAWAKGLLENAKQRYEKTKQRIQQGGKGKGTK